MAEVNTIFNNLDHLLGYLTKASNYKPVRKKVCTIWCCKPEAGVHVSSTTSPSFVTDERNCFVLSGTRGEMWAADMSTLTSDYTFGDGTPITAVNLRAKQKNGVIDWFQIKTVVDKDATLFATFIPARYSFDIVSKRGVYHANFRREATDSNKGDFVVCANKNGQPDLNDRWVVNGAIFADTFDNRGWGECVASSHAVKGTPPKPTIALTDTEHMLRRELVGAFSSVMPMETARRFAGVALDKTKMPWGVPLLQQLKKTYGKDARLIARAMDEFRYYRRILYRELAKEQNLDPDLRKRLEQQEKEGAVFDIDWDNTGIQFRRIITNKKRGTSEISYCIEDKFEIEGSEVTFDTKCYSVSETALPEIHLQLDFETAMKAFFDCDTSDALYATLMPVVKASVKQLVAVLTKPADVKSKEEPQPLKAEGMRKLIELFKQQVDVNDIFVRETNVELINNTLEALGKTKGQQSALVQLICRARKDVVKGLVRKLTTKGWQYEKYLTALCEYLDNPKSHTMIDTACEDKRGLRLLSCWNDIVLDVEFCIQDDMALHNPCSFVFFIDNREGGTLDDYIDFKTSLPFLKSIAIKKHNNDPSYKAEYTAAINADIESCVQAIVRLETGK